MTHLQLKDGKLLPIEELYLRREGTRIVFKLASNDEIKEEYSTASEAIAAYDIYTSMLLTGIPFSSFLLIDTVNGLTSTITVENGVLTVNQ